MGLHASPTELSDPCGRRAAGMCGGVIGEKPVAGSQAPACRGAFGRRRICQTPDVSFDGLVIVAGVPGSGKTTLARDLARRLAVPLISKDTIKEGLFDALGSGDLAWSRSLGRASHVVMYAVAAEAGSAVLDSHFWRGTAEPDLMALSRPLVQVYCRCPVELAVLRYRQRMDSPDRHPGHHPEHQSDEVIESWSTVEPRPLDLGAPLIEVDTTRAVDIDALASRIEGSV